MTIGYVAIHRQLQQSDLWLGETFTRGQAWVDLIMLANFSDSTFRIRGIKVPVKRGQLAYSKLTLADRWKWSRGKVTRFLDELETEQQIRQQNTKLTTLISIVNYDLYQNDSTTNEATDGQQTDNKRTHKNKGKKVKKDNNKPIGEEFEIPSGINQQAWQEFEQHRKTINKPLTNLARKKNIQVLIGHYEPVQQAIVDKTIANRWTGLFPIDNTSSRGTPNEKSGRSLSAPERVERANEEKRRQREQQQRPRTEIDINGVVLEGGPHRAAMGKDG